MNKVARVERYLIPACFDCGLPYTGAGWVDAVVPDEYWLKISPTGHGGGLLCIHCMTKRFTDLGITNVPLKVYEKTYLLPERDRGNEVMVKKPKSVDVWAAFNPETGECMLPTVRGWKAGAVAERDQFYKGCPIHQCLLSPLFPEEDEK